MSDCCKNNNNVRKFRIFVSNMIQKGSYVLSSFRNIVSNICEGVIEIVRFNFKVFYSRRRMIRFANIWIMSKKYWSESVQSIIYNVKIKISKTINHGKPETGKRSIESLSPIKLIVFLGSFIWRNSVSNSRWKMWRQWRAKR